RSCRFTVAQGLNWDAAFAAPTIALVGRSGMDGRIADPSARTCNRTRRVTRRSGRSLRPQQRETERDSSRWIALALLAGVLARPECAEERGNRNEDCGLMPPHRPYKSMSDPVTKVDARGFCECVQEIPPPRLVEDSRQPCEQLSERSDSTWIGADR